MQQAPLKLCIVSYEALGQKKMDNNIRHVEGSIIIVTTGHFLQQNTYFKSYELLRSVKKQIHSNARNHRENKQIFSSK